MQIVRVRGSGAVSTPSACLSAAQGGLDVFPGINLEFGSWDFCRHVATF